MGVYLEGKETYERLPDVKEWNKGHGRLECRELWLEECGELGEYLEKEYDWPEMKWCGVIKKRYKKLGEREWKEEQEVWVAGGGLERLTAQEALGGLRGHWGIENRVFWVRDVSCDEDRLHGRKIGLGLSSLRNVAINILRTLRYRYIPDGWRAMAARFDRGLDLLFDPIKS